MTKRSTKHATFTIERSFAAAPARVFAAYADAKSKARWFGGPDEWEKSNLVLDFRVGGRESVSGGPAGGPVHRYSALYQDIVPDQRIVLTYEMYLDETRISVSLGTTELKPDGKGPGSSTPSSRSFSTAMTMQAPASTARARCSTIWRRFSRSHPSIARRDDDAIGATRHHPPRAPLRGAAGAGVRRLGRSGGACQVGCARSLDDRRADS